MKYRFLLIITVVIISVTWLTGCQKSEVSTIKNIEQIHNDEGIPVRVKDIKETVFYTFLNYTSSLKGVSESTASAIVSDEVVEVHAQVGDFIEKDQVIITFPVDNPVIQYEQSKVAYESAEKAFSRIKRIYENSGVSRQEYDDAYTQFEVTRANWFSIQKMVAVPAPISGYLTRLNVQSTDNVGSGDELFTISNYDRLKTTIWVSDQEILHINRGQKAVAEWEGHLIYGDVVQVDLSMDRSTRAFAVLLEFDNYDHTILSGITAEIRIITYTKENSLVLNRKEMIKEGDTWFTFLAENGVSSKTELVTGFNQGMNIEILQGIEIGDLVITEGISLVRDGSRIKILSDNTILSQK